MLTARTALWSFLALVATGSASAGDAAPTFEQDVLPILRARCLKCHGSAQRKGGLSLRTPAAMLEGGDSGPALVRGNVDESLIVEQIDSGAMPPAKSPRLSEAEAATIKAWVAAGAPADSLNPAGDPADEPPAHWAFRPPARPELPRPGNRNPIDAFLLERLEAAGLSYSPEADRRTLIRRATFDLWGL